VFNLGASFGAILAPPLIAWSILHFNWHAAFLIAGGLALCWAVLWLVFYRNPNRHEALSTEEAAYIAAGQEPTLRANDDKKPSVREILMERSDRPLPA